MRTLIRYFIRKSLLVNLITFLVLFIGIINLSFLRKEGFPPVDEKKLRITTLYPGASPEDVELNVTFPIEESLKGVEGIEKFSSVSRENYSTIWVFIDRDFADAEKVKFDIRRAVDNVSDLPKEIKKRPDIWEWKVSNFGVLEVGVYSSTLPEKQLRTRTLDLKKRILDLPQVSKHYESGIRDREIHIKLDLVKLNEYHIPFEEIINAIKANNIQVSGGTLESYTSEKRIVTFAKFNNLMDVGNIVVRSTFEGNRILLKDIAKIEDTFQEEYAKIRFNGKKGMMVKAVKKENADIIKTVKAIKKCVRDYKKSLKGEDIDFTYLWDMSEETVTRLTIVQRNALIGLVLVVCVLFIFLNIRNAIWTAVGIPFSFCFAVLFFPLFNVTINSIALLGVVIVLGMIVDDAIIISENIYRHRIEGEEAVGAGINATEEVCYPVMSTILTTIVAFIPILFVKGMVGDFARDIPVVVALVLAGSLFEAMFLLPNHVTRHSIEGQTLKEKKFMTVLKTRYSRVLYKALEYRYLVILFFLILSGITYYLVQYKMKFEMFPDVDAHTFWIRGRTKEIKSLEYTSDKVKEIEKFVIDTYDEETVKSFVTGIGNRGYPENFSFTFYLRPAAERKIKSSEIISAIREKIEEMDVFTSLHFEKDTGGPPTGRGVEITLTGNDDIKRKRISDRIAKYLQNTDGVYDITRSDEETKKEIKITPNRTEIARLGVTAFNIANAIKIAYEGLIVTDLRVADESIEYRVTLDDKYKRKLEILDKLKTANNQGKLVPISQMVEINESLATMQIHHYDGDKATEISADVNSEIITPTEIYTKINNDFRYFEAENPGFRLILGGEAEESTESLVSMIRSLWIAIAGVSFILVLLFKSISQPLMVLFTIPFGLIGVVLAFYAHGMVLSIMALLGVVGLSGVVVNDSLVMVGFMNMLKKNNPDKNIIDIATRGAVGRLRPILLTTITTVVSIFPTAYGIGGMDFMITPSVLALFWGLIFATTLTLFLIPCLYVIEHNLKKNINNLLSSIRTRKNKTLTVLIFLTTSLISGRLYSAEKNIVNLKDFINDTKRNNPEIFAELTKIKTSKATQLQTKAIYDIVFNIHYNRLYDRPFSDYDAVKMLKQNTDNIGIDLQAVIPNLGTRINTGIEYNKSNLKFSPSPLIPFDEIDYYHPELFLNITQPLLKNWLGITDSLPIKQANLNTLIVKQTVDESIENITADLYSIYFDWYLVYNQYKVYSDNVKNSEILLKQTKKKLNKGLADKSDLSKVEIMNIEYKKAKHSFKANLDSIKKKIYRWQTGKSTHIPSNLDIYPEKELHIPELNILNFSVSNARQMQILSLTRQLLEHQLNKEKNNNLPELNLILSHKVRNYTTDGTKAFENLDYENYIYGITFTHPFGRHLSRGKLEETISKIKKWDNDVTNFEGNYTQSFDELVRVFEMYERILEYDRNLIKHAQIQLKEEEKKYKQGRSDLYFVIQHRNTLLDYKLTYVKDYINHKRTAIQLLSLLDNLK